MGKRRNKFKNKVCRVTKGTTTERGNGEESRSARDRVITDLEEEVTSMDDQDRAMLPVLLCGLHNVMSAQLSAGLVRVGGSE